MYFRGLLLALLTISVFWSVPSACNRESAATDSAGDSGTVAGASAQSSSSKMLKGPTDVLILTDSTFSKYVNQDTPVALIDFYATWCGPCKLLAPKIEELAKENGGRVVFGKVDTDQNRRLSSTYGIRKLPTLIIYKNGEAVDTIIGYQSKSYIQDRIDKAAK